MTMKNEILKFIGNKFFQTRQKAFTLIELLITLSLVAIICAVIVPNFLTNQKKAKDDNALARSAVLDLAKDAFVQAKGIQQAKTLWAQASNDEARFSLLQSYIGGSSNCLNNSDGNDRFAPIGYDFHLNGLMEQTTVTGAPDCGCSG